MTQVLDASDNKLAIESGKHCIVSLYVLRFCRYIIFPSRNWFGYRKYSQLFILWAVRNIECMKLFCNVMNAFK